MPRSLAMSEHSLVKGTPQAIRDWLMSLPEASPVSRSVWQESNSEPMTQETCGLQQLTASASYDPDTHSWKTCQGWLLADILEPSFQDFTKAGMTVDGAFYPQPNWERRINEIAYGLEPNGETFFHTPTTGGLDGGSNSRKALAKRLSNSLPTPTANDGKGAGRKRFKGSDHYRGAKVSEALRTKQDDPIYPNPYFLEWLMGWCIGWTELEPLAMDKFQLWLQQHGDCLEVSEL